MSAKHSRPSLPPTTTMTFPMRFAVWYPRGVGPLPLVSICSQRMRSIGPLTSSAQTSLSAVVPFPPPKT